MIETTRRWRFRKVFAGAVSLLAAASLAAGVGLPATTAAAEGIIPIGTTLPMTGALARFGYQTLLGYQAAVNMVNAHGGIVLHGQRYKVKLIYLDNQSQPQLASQQANTLVLSDHVVGLLGSVTPPLGIPVSLVAEARHVPEILLNPIRAWLSGAPRGGYRWAWDLSFDEYQMTRNQFLTMNEVKSNRKVALFTDNEQDGFTMGALWEKYAPQYGYKVVYRAIFPVGTTDFGPFIRKAKASGADILIAQMLTPDAVALWKQMHALGWVPKAAFMEKAAGSADWWTSLGRAGNGACVVAWWTPTMGLPQTSLAIKLFRHKLADNEEMGQATTAYTVTMILLDAIKRAGSLDPTAIDKAIGETHGWYMSGYVRFNKQHFAPERTVEVQWYNGEVYQVYPPVKSYKFKYPLSSIE